MVSKLIYINADLLKMAKRSDCYSLRRVKARIGSNPIISAKKLGCRQVGPQPSYIYSPSIPRDSD